MNIKKMIPFLDDEELSLLAEKIMASPSNEYEGVQMTDLLPFLDEDVIGQSMLKDAAIGRPISSYFPFVSDEDLSQLVQLFINGAPIDNMRKAIPFLSDDDVALLYQKVLEANGEYRGLTLSMLLPFADDELIDKTFILYAEKGDPRTHDFAPFASDSALHRVAEDYLNGKCPSLQIEDLYVFFDDQDIKAIFTAYLHNH